MSRKAESQLQTSMRHAWSRRDLLIGGTAMAGAAALPWRLAEAQDLPSLNGRDPKTLVVAVDASVDNLDPATNIEWAYGLRPVYDTLVELKEGSTTEIQPRLAEEVTSNDDGTVWTFRLRKGVRFHDGTDCDAAAVKAAITRSIYLPVGIGFLWEIEDPESQIEVLDSHTLRFTFPDVRPLFGLEVAGQYGFWIASPTAAEANSKGEEDLGSEWLKANPVGTGPYKMESNEPGQQVVLAKNPDYWGGWETPHFERIITQTIPLAGTRRQLLEEGAVDLIWPGTPEDTEALGKDPRFVVTDAPTLTMQYVALGNYGPLADPRARQAINLAFDNEAFIRDVVRDTQDVPVGAFPMKLQTADTDTKTLGFDLGEARALLDAAGVAPGTELTYEYFTGFGNVAGELLQAWLAEIGITLKLVEKSFSGFIADYFSDAPAEERANMYFFSWWPGVDHPFSYAFQLFHSGGWGSLGGNAGYYKNEEAEGLIDAMY